MNVIIFTCVGGIFFQRSIGAYQVAHFLREHGYTVQIIDFTDYFTEEELIAVIDKFITEDTLAIGLSTTFYTINEFNSKFIHNNRNKFDFLEFPTNVLAAIEFAKKKYPNIKIMMGGAKSEAGKLIPYVDVVIHGYAEDKVLNYLDSLPSKKKQKKKLIQISTEDATTPLVIKDEPLEVQFSIETLKHRFQMSILRVSIKWKI
jgi:hypothetical protein